MQPNHEHYHKPQQQKRSWWFTFPGVVCAIILSAIFFTLIIDHRQHIADNWFLLILLLCPAMHFFMHRGHNHKHPHDDKGEK